jgi:hypothetical protein
MISDRALVLAAAATYEPKAVPIIEAIDHAVRIFRTSIDGLAVFAIEGTHDDLGWALDFVAAGADDHETFNHPTLGFVHAGFHMAAMAVFPRMALAAQGIEYAITGHSLGGELALHLGGMMIDDGHPPVKIGAFAPPRGGGAQFVKVVTSVPFCAYHFGNDPVPDVPLMLPGFPYEQVPLTMIGRPMFNPFKAHHVDNYVNAIGAEA